MNRTFKILFSILFLILLIAQTSYCEVRLRHLVSNGMIPQSEIPLKIWGWASAGEKVELQINNQSYNTVTGNDEKWQITLPAKNAGGPLEMKIIGSNQIILKELICLTRKDCLHRR